jgi:hypothetical protein
MRGADVNHKKLHFSYRYAIYRAGLFHRWEQPTDGASDENQDLPINPHRVCHEIPLNMLQNRETYVANDILGVTWAAADIDHIVVKRMALRMPKLHRF